MRTFVLFSLGFLLCSSCVAQWRTANPPSVSVVQTSYEWKRMHPHQDWLYKSECDSRGCTRAVLVGAMDYEADHFIPHVNGDWGQAVAEPPIACPVKRMKNAITPTGVLQDKLHQGAEKFEVRGQQLDRRQALEAFEGAPGTGGTLKDDSSFLRLTVISRDKAKRDSVLRELFADGDADKIKDRLAIWSVGPDHFSLEPGFKKDVDGIYIQAADGTVLHRQEGLETSRLLDALRRADPKYNPKNDDDLSRWLSFLGVPTDSWKNYLWVALAFVGGLAIRSQPQPSKGSA